MSYRPTANLIWKKKHIEQNTLETLDNTKISSKPNANISNTVIVTHTYNFMSNKQMHLMKNTNRHIMVSRAEEKDVKMSPTTVEVYNLPLL